MNPVEAERRLTMNTLNSTLTPQEAVPMPEQNPHPPALIERRRKTPFIAGLLSLMPGLGQVYVGYYRRGFLHVLTAGAVITVLEAGDLEALEPLFGMFLAFFWIYNIVDAVRLANLYNDALAGLGPLDLRHELVLMGKRGSVGVGAALILVGFLVLLNRVAGISMEWLADWWPLVPIAFGGYLLWQGVKDRQMMER